MAYEDGGHCGHEIGQKLWKWGSGIPVVGRELLTRFL